MRIPIEGSTSYRGRNSRPHWLVLAAFIGSAIAVGAIGMLFSPRMSAASNRWYALLLKPDWAPRQSWFGSVWMVPYLLMGSAAWLIWRERYHLSRGTALTAYGVQLVLGAVWAPLFFGAGSVGAGLFVIVALWLSVVWTMREFAVVKGLAAWLLGPYLIWVSGASALNLAIWKLNQ
jgi:translocator protein